MRKSHTFRPTVNDQLEDRTVPSGFRGPATQVLSFLNGNGVGRALGNLGLGDFGLGRGGRDLGRRVFGALDSLGRINATSNLLSQDALAVQRAFQQFNATAQSALATLRQTATTSNPPTGQGAFNSTIASAISTLNGRITSALSNLPNTGGSLASTIQGFTATLQSNLASAATGLEDSTSTAVLATRREMPSYIRTALSQSIGAILNNQPAGTITPTTLRTFNQDVRAAYQDFRTAISGAVQTAIANGTQLDSSVVGPAVEQLRSDLTSAINDLGLTDPSALLSTVNTRLTALQTRLTTTIQAPRTGSNTSARLFLRLVSSAIAQGQNSINQAVANAVRAFNNSLL